jgi:rod shape-determining protein MreB
VFSDDISIDLGTATMLVYIKNKGIVLNEPTVIAVDTDTNEVKAVGAAAVDMLGRTPPNIHAVRPLIDGVISNLTLTREMIKYFLSKIRAIRFGHPRIMMCVPSGITDVEQRAVIEAARDAGAKDIYVIEEPVAAALGAGKNISEPRGTMVVDIGGGTTDVAVISLGGIVISRSLKIAGDELNDAVARYMKRAMNLYIGPLSAERVKKEIGSVVERTDDRVTEVRGLSVITGLPRAVKVSANELRSEFEEYVYNIIERIREVLEVTPPELHSDIIEDGILLTGGGALIYGLDRRISDAIGVKCTVAQDPIECVAKGAGIALENIDIAEDPTHIYHKKAYIRD